MSWFHLKHDLKTSLWVVPLLFMVAAAGLNLLTVQLDPRGELVPQSISGDASAASQMLYLIAFSMLTLTGLVLSLVVVVVQLAMGSFSPRIVRQILQDRPSQCAIGLFAGTFIHAILTMRVVRSDRGPVVPGLAVLVTIGLGMACMITLVWYINYIGQSLRAAALVGWVAKDTIRSLDRNYPPDPDAETDDPQVIPAPRGGVIFAIDHDRLVQLARRAGVGLELLWSTGDYVPEGGDLVRIHGDPAGVARSAVARCINVGPERTLNQDVAYGLRMLVDIGARTLSAGPFEDPTTAVQAIDRIHEVLRRIVQRPLHDGRYLDDDGEVRLVVPTIQWPGYVRIAFDELRQAGAASPQVVRRLRAALDDLLAIAPEDRRPPLVQQLELLDQLSQRDAQTGFDAEAVKVPDRSGIGSADELTRTDP